MLGLVVLKNNFICLEIYLHFKAIAGALSDSLERLAPTKLRKGQLELTCGSLGYFDMTLLAQQRIHDSRDIRSCHQLSANIISQMTVVFRFCR